MGIDIKDKKLRKISLKISTTESEYKNYLRRDNLNELVESTDNIIEKNNLNEEYGNRFKNTLFNFLGKIDLKKDQSKIEVYEYTDKKNNKNARLVYNLKLKCRVSTYCENEYKTTNNRILLEDNSIKKEKVNKFNTSKMANTKFIPESEKEKN